ncbi:MAG: hypothetical protein IJU50_05395 [Lachnospiraceae bacterium]|nr:hypothetical protein [Lachnospiraceae bacterium]
MSQIISYVLFAVMAIMGGGTTLLLLITLPGLIIWKIYRCIKYGYKIID